MIPKPPMVKLAKGEDPSLYSFYEGASMQLRADAEYYEGKYGKELDELKVQISDLNKRISGFREQVRAEVLREGWDLYMKTVATHPVDVIPILHKWLKSGTMPDKEE